MGIRYVTEKIYTLERLLLVLGGRYFGVGYFL